MIKIMIEGGGYNKLSVFDFDGTLFKSPLKPEKYKGNWWSSKESLDYPNVPKRPDEKFWIMNTVNDAREELNNNKIFTMLLTGRVDTVFDERIRKLLKQQGLNFNYIKLNSFGQDTGDFKVSEIKKILKRFPNIKKIEMWEDEQEKAELYKETFSEDYSFKLNKLPWLGE